MIIINFPQQIKTTGNGYAELVYHLNSLLETTNNETVFLDLSNLYWMDANLLAVSGACFEHKKNDVKIKFNRKDLKNQIIRIWGKNGFGRYFGIPKIDDTYNSVVGYKVFTAKDGKKFGEYIDEVLLTKEDLPVMSNSLKKQISKNIQEIFGNAPMHGRCKEVTSCGQIYPSAKCLMFTIVNIGYTIKQNVHEYFSFYLKQSPPKHSIEWAVIEDHSTKRILNGKSGGKGLAFLREFIMDNKGEIDILSDDEYWETSTTGTKATNMYTSFPGTIVTIKINLNDNKSYDAYGDYDFLDDLF